MIGDLITVIIYFGVFSLLAVIGCAIEAIIERFWLGGGKDE